MTGLCPGLEICVGMAVCSREKRCKLIEKIMNSLLGREETRARDHEGPVFNLHC